VWRALFIVAGSSLSFSRAEYAYLYACHP
jgi:hypothetical protein